MNTKSFVPVLDMGKINAVVAREGQIIGNLVAAIDVMTQVPDERVDLRMYVCGTNACAAGWLATVPFFLEQVDVEDQETAAFDISFKPGAWGDESLAVTGEDIVSWDALFAPAMTGTFDGELYDKHGGENNTSDKQLALARLNHVLDATRFAAAFDEAHPRPAVI